MNAALQRGGRPPTRLRNHRVSACSGGAHRRRKLACGTRLGELKADVLALAPRLDAELDELDRFSAQVGETSAWLGRTSRTAQPAGFGITWRLWPLPRFSARALSAVILPSVLGSCSSRMQPMGNGPRPWGVAEGRSLEESSLEGTSRGLSDAVSTRRGLDGMGRSTELASLGETLGFCEDLAAQEQPPCTGFFEALGQRRRHPSRPPEHEARTGATGLCPKQRPGRTARISEDLFFPVAMAFGFCERRATGNPRGDRQPRRQAVGRLGISARIAKPR
jgi:hypothetical protein